jgi:hypothetical protein
MHIAFHSAPITLEHWGYILAVGVATLFIVEFEKWLTNRSARRSETEGLGDMRAGG